MLSARKFSRTAFSLVLSFGLLVFSSDFANALPTCNDTIHFRAGDDSNDQNADGVRANIQVPASADVQHYSRGPGTASVADIFLWDRNGGGFVQWGWYVGQLNADTPYTSTPRLFAGESLASGGEELRAFDTIGWNVNHAFKILRNYAGAGSIDFYYEGNKVASADEHHPYVDDAAFVGEVDWQYTTMWADAWPGSSDPTLEDHIGTTWYEFVDHRYDMQNYGFFSVSDGGRATDYAYGGGAAYCSP